MKKSFKISNQEYCFYIKYLDLIENEKLLHAANNRIEKYTHSNPINKTDHFLNYSMQNYFDLFFLDILSKFFFRKSIVRLKLNLILALHEAEYNNFNHMIYKLNFKTIIFDILKFTIVSLSSPLWLSYKFLSFKISFENKNVSLKK